MSQAGGAPPRFAHVGKRCLVFLDFLGELLFSLKVSKIRAPETKSMPVFL